MGLPAGITIEGKKYVKLLKAVYGLKQAPNLWYQACQIAILESEPRLTRMKSDPCFFFCFTKELIALITITVDDFAIFTNDESWFYSFKEKFHAKYAVTQEPSFDWFLGIKMDWSTDGTEVKLTQPNHINAALVKYHMEDSKDVPTPMVTDFDSAPLPSEHINPDFPYSGIIGTLMWIARNTRPDILTAVTLLASHNNRFSDYHIKQAKRVLAYLKSTKEYGIKIQKEPNFDMNKPIKLVMYSDFDWARDKIKRRSVTGFVGYFMGSPIVTQSHYQPTIAQSSCEAEYMAMSSALKEILHFINLFEEIKILKLETPVVIHVDNTGAIDIATTLSCNKRTKHIDVRHHFIRDNYEKGIIAPMHIPTEKNIADIFTKPLGEALFLKHREKLVSNSVG